MDVPTIDTLARIAARQGSRRGLLAAAAGAATAALGGRRVRAGGAACTLAEQPDQNTLYGVNPGGAHAQTFVPDATGPLQQAAVWVWKDWDSPDDFVVSVLRVDAAGTPRFRKPLARARVPATPLGGGQRQVVARFGADGGRS